MATHKKIHSCKPLNAMLKPKLAREYFFLQPKKNFFPPFLFLIKLFRHRTGTVLYQTVGASNVNSFADRFVYDIGQTQLRCEKSGDTHNMGYTTMRGSVLRMTVLCKVEHLCFV